MRLVKDDGTRGVSAHLRMSPRFDCGGKETNPFWPSIFRIAISRGALCHVFKLYFRFRLLRLSGIHLRTGLDKNFPQRESAVVMEGPLAAKIAKENRKVSRETECGRARISFRTRLDRSVEIVLRRTAWLPLSSGDCHRVARLQPHRESV